MWHRGSQRWGGMVLFSRATVPAGDKCLSIAVMPIFQLLAGLPRSEVTDEYRTICCNLGWQARIAA